MAQTSVTLTKFKMAVVPAWHKMVFTWSPASIFVPHGRKMNVPSGGHSGRISETQDVPRTQDKFPRRLDWLAFRRALETSRTKLPAPHLFGDALNGSFQKFATTKPFRRRRFQKRWFGARAKSAGRNRDRFFGGVSLVLSKTVGKRV